MPYLKKDDPVIILSGNNRGMQGKILRVLGDRVVVQGVNVRKRHVKPTQESPKGRVLQVERPIAASNVALEVDGKPVKLCSRMTNDGSKEVYYKDGGEAVVYRTLRKGG